MSNTISSFATAWQFIRWADERQLLAARSVPDDAAYHREQAISHKSVHRMLLHMMSGQASWLRAWGAASGLPDHSAETCPDLTAIERFWPAVHTALGGYLAGLAPVELDRPIRFSRRGHDLVLPLGDTISHMIDHSGYHRGQLNTLVKLAGGQPVAVSYWIYALRMHPQESGVTDGDFM
ncbi:MAG TPA: DinB family protein [Tepidisphaeraceae bacterium]|nr:DinB family protein [Tepidisphaeraceae bacterium]